MDLDYDHKLFKGNQNLSQDLSAFADLNMNKEDPTNSEAKESDEQLKDKEFLIAENKNTIGIPKYAIGCLPTKETTSTKKDILYKDWKEFLLRITIMLNSILVKEYNFTKMLCCPDLDSIEGEYGPKFQQMNLYDLFTFNYERNCKIIHSILDKEKKQNKTCFCFLMGTSFKEMRTYYKNDCKIITFDNYIYDLIDHLDTPNDNNMTNEEPKKRRIREKKKPKEKNVKEKKGRKNNKD